MNDVGNDLRGKRILLLKDIKFISINTDTCELINESGDTLRFGYDYFLLEGQHDDKMLRVYDSDNELLHQIEFDMNT